ncbi:Crp/Fnr family transcriptional regulator [Robiginitalea sediminis]|uniref:Crp/Fnr family transcriptional regulator n=1 Tax=Robiginitalea sediminis TaxID=1982593 RepID=UPI001E43C7AE|nr:Crp/Fnr family transcriptional regulator [Robiginitalea sediminis]
MAEVMVTELRKYISGFVALTDQEMELVLTAFEYRQVPRRTQLLRAGEVCSFEAFILSGCAREYYVDDKGSEHTVEFALERWWISDIYSFENQVPSRVSIETLEDTELLVLSPETKASLLEEVPKMERMFRLMMQRHLNVVKNRLLRNMSDTAMDRYLLFLERYPDVIRRVPQYYIASYLGISQEFLSKLRRRAVKAGE